MPSDSNDEQVPRSSLPTMLPTNEGSKAEKRTYGDILRSSALIGSSSLVNVAVGIVRTKAMAMLLGPAGFGLMGMYGAILDLANSIANLGIGSSGVRQMAEASSSGDAECVARTATVLRRVSVFLGIFGSALLILFAEPLSRLTFANGEHAGAIAQLSLAVFFACVAGGEAASIQGMRRIADLAKMSVLGSVGGAIASILLVYFFGEQGVIPTFLAAAVIGTLTSLWYGRKIQISAPFMRAAQVGREALGLLKLGLAFMASALMMTGASYAVRLILLRESGLEAAGLFQSAWTLGSLYIGFILQAMGSDFYPRLTGVAKDNCACNRMVNEQAEISLLLAGPGVLATLTFAPPVIFLFYSAEFNGAGEILRWICLGMSLRIIVWPIGFIILAKGAQNLFFWTELAWTVGYLALALAFVPLFGLTGAGVAFVGAQLGHGLLVYLIVRRLSGFRWLNGNKRMASIFFLLITSVFCAMFIFPPGTATMLGAAATVLSGIYSYRALVEIASSSGILHPIRELLVRCRLRVRSLNK